MDEIEKRKEIYDRLRTSFSLELAAPALTFDDERFVTQLIAEHAAMEAKLGKLVGRSNGKLIFIYEECDDLVADVGRELLRK